MRCDHGVQDVLARPARSPGVPLAVAQLMGAEIWCDEVHVQEYSYATQEARQYDSESLCQADTDL